MTDHLVADLRRFMLTYGEHDADCPGHHATGPAAVDADLCSCGFIPRMDELLAAVAERVGDSRKTSALQMSQRAVCARYGAPFTPIPADQMCAISEGVYQGDPVQGVRCEAPAHMSGWYLTTARSNGDHTTLKVDHVAHVAERRPDIAVFLALPPGYRFDTTGGSANAWHDPAVARQRASG